MDKSKVEKFNDIINRLEISIDECLPDTTAFLVDATETLNDAFYVDGISKQDYNKAKRRIDNISNRFFKECLCENIKTEDNIVRYNDQERRAYRKSFEKMW